MFLHRLVMELLLCKNTYVEREDFADYSCQIQELDPETGEAEMTSQFKASHQFLVTTPRD